MPATQEVKFLDPEQFDRMLDGVRKGTNYEEGERLVCALLDNQRYALLMEYGSDEEAKAARLGVIAYAKSEGVADRILARKSKGRNVVIVADLEHPDVTEDAKLSKQLGIERSAIARAAKGANKG